MRQGLVWRGQLRTHRRGAGLSLAVLLCLLSALADPFPAVVIAEETAPQRSGAVFAAVAEFWQTRDHAALAALVSTDGVRISVGPADERATLFSPSQAFYFFRNLFETRQTASFRYLRVQETAQSGRVYAVARWRHRWTGTETIEDMRLMISLNHGKHGWALVEIKALR